MEGNTTSLHRRRLSVNTPLDPPQLAWFHLWEIGPFKGGKVPLCVSPVHPLASPRGDGWEYTTRLRTGISQLFQKKRVSTACSQEQKLTLSPRRKESARSPYPPVERGMHALPAENTAGPMNHSQTGLAVSAQLALTRAWLSP